MRPIRWVGNKMDFDKEKISTITKIFYFVTPYAFLSSFLYLVGFWSTFDINIFEFITISEIILITAYPLFLSLIGILIGFAIGLMLTEGVSAEDKAGIYFWNIIKV